MQFPTRPLRDGMLVCIAALACALSSIWWLYSHAREAQTRAVRADLQHIAQSAATLIPGDLHRKLSSPAQAESPDTGRRWSL